MKRFLDLSRSFSKKCYCLKSDLKVNNEPRIHGNSASGLNSIQIVEQSANKFVMKIKT